MNSDPSGDYYDYTKTMQPERPWLVDWHQRFGLAHGEGVCIRPAAS